jgi:hypothetical protein
MILAEALKKAGLVSEEKCERVIQEKIKKEKKKIEDNLKLSVEIEKAGTDEEDFE